MRLFAVHDAAGMIQQVITCPAVAPAPSVETPPGLSFVEIDPPEGLTEDADLQEFLKNHRVELAPASKQSVVRL